MVTMVVVTKKEKKKKKRKDPLILLRTRHCVLFVTVADLVHRAHIREPAS